MSIQKQPSFDLQADYGNGKIHDGYKKQCHVKGMKKKEVLRISKRRTATLRKDGRYQVYIKTDDGKRKACYGQSEYLANCNADIREADEEMRVILAGEGRFVFKYCFYRYRNYLLFYTSLETQTVDRYEATYNKYFLNSKIALMDIRHISTEAIEEFLNAVLHNNQGRITNKEYQRIRHIIKAVIEFIWDFEIEYFDPQMADCPSLDWGRIRRRIPRGKIYNKVKKEYAVSQKDKDILKEKGIEQNVYPAKFAHVIMLIINFSLGLRIGELAALQADDVDMDGRVVYVNKSSKRHSIRDDYGNMVGRYSYYDGSTKTPKGIREIPISDTAYELFNVLFQYRKLKNYRSKYLAYDGEDVRSRTGELSRTLEELCKKVDIKEFHSHIIRKTFASSLSKSPDIDLATIAEYLGHAQVSTTLNNYIIPTNDAIDYKIQQMSRYV